MNGVCGMEISMRKSDYINKLVIFLYVATFIMSAVLILIPPKKNVTASSGGEDIVIRKTVQEETEFFNNKSTEFVTYEPCHDADINKLIRNFYKALASGDENELQKYTDKTEIYQELLGLNESYVSNYINLSCYYAEGFLDNTYVVMAYSYIKYKNISTTVPNLDLFYVCMNASGTYYISNQIVSEEVSAYIDMMKSNKDVEMMQGIRDEEYQEALESDEQLEEFFKKLTQD